MTVKRIKVLSVENDKLTFELYDLIFVAYVIIDIIARTINIRGVHSYPKRHNTLASQ